MFYVFLSVQGFFLHICLKVKLVLLGSLNYIDLQWLTHSIVYLPFQGLHCKVYHWFVTLFLFRQFSFEKLGVHYTAFILALGRQPSPKQRNNNKFMSSVLKYFISCPTSLLLCFSWIETAVTGSYAEMLEKPVSHTAVLTAVLGPPCSSQHFTFLLNSCKGTVCMDIVFLLNIVLA